jgi:hypothetical protein
MTVSSFALSCLVLLLLIVNEMSVDGDGQLHDQYILKLIPTH